MCLMLGNKYMLDGRYEKALVEYENCLVRKPEAHEVALLGLVCALVVGDALKVDYFAKALEAMPEGVVEVNLPRPLDTRFRGRVEQKISDLGASCEFSGRGDVLKLIKKRKKDEEV